MAGLNLTQKHPTVAVRVQTAMCAPVKRFSTFAFLLGSIFVLCFFVLCVTACGETTRVEQATPGPSPTLSATFSAARGSRVVAAAGEAELVESAGSAAAVALSLQVDTVTSTVAGTARVSGHLVGATPNSLALSAGIDVVVSTEGDAASSRRVMKVSSADPSKSPAPFLLDVDGLAPGPQTLCLADDCHRVLVAKETHETPAQINEKILMAMARANQIFDFTTELPEWQVVIAGPSTGAGGHFSPGKRTIAISGTSGRTVDEFVTTILHEVGHAIDHDYVTVDERAQFRSLRGIDPALKWQPDGLAPDQRWASPAEDFAEVFVAWLTNGEHQTRSVVAGQPSADDLAIFSQLVDELA